MSFQKFETKSYCNGGRHIFASTIIYVDLISKASKVIHGQCSKCNKEKSKTVCDNIITAEDLGVFFKFPGKKGPNNSKKMAKDVLRYPGRALEIAAIVGTAFSSRRPKTALSSPPEVMSFYHTRKGLYLGMKRWITCMYQILSRTVSNCKIKTKEIGKEIKHLNEHDNSVIVLNGILGRAICKFIDLFFRRRRHNKLDVKIVSESYFDLTNWIVRNNSIKINLFT